MVNLFRRNVVSLAGVCIEEPESHLHPNAQKKLYSQISTIPGQKIIATHSPYIAASSDLNQIRSFYKGDENVICGKVNTNDLSPEDLRKISRMVVNTRGEVFFSKAVIFFEGETEEQALPIFANHYFKKTPAELGIDFVGVGGHGNYLPFLRVTEGLNIPWFILSDAEIETKKSVRKQFVDSKSTKDESDVIIFLEDENNFENQLIKDGYVEEIKEAILETQIVNCVSEEERKALKKQIFGYDDEKIYQVIKKSKAILGPAIADVIVKSGKELPPKVLVLFEKVKELLIDKK